MCRTWDPVQRSHTDRSDLYPRAQGECAADRYVQPVREIITGVTDLFDYPKLTVKATSDKYLLNGNVFVPVDVDTVDDIQIDERSLTSINSKNKYFMVYISTGQFIGIYEWINKEKKYKPYKMFL